MTGKAMLAALAVLAASGTVALAQGGAPEPVRQIERADGPGRALFLHQCAPCHGTGPGADGAPMLPGTAALAAKYQGRLPAQLELRTDLSAPVLRLFVRRGSGAMPAFRPSELTEGQITQIADYLAATARLNAR